MCYFGCFVIGLFVIRHFVLGVLYPLPFIYSFINSSFIILFIHLFIYPSIRFFLYLFFLLFMQFILKFSFTFTLYLYFHSFIDSIIYLFISLISFFKKHFIHSCIQLLIFSIYSFNPGFKMSLLYLPLVTNSSAALSPEEYIYR